MKKKNSLDVTYPKRILELLKAQLLFLLIIASLFFSLAWERTLVFLSDYLWLLGFLDKAVFVLFQITVACIAIKIVNHFFQNKILEKIKDNYKKNDPRCFKQYMSLDYLHNYIY